MIDWSRQATSWPRSVPTNQRERKRECSHIVLVPTPKTINNNHCDPLAAAQIQTRLPAQLDRPADCWPTPESEINSLFSLMRENMQTSRQARRYAKSWHEDRGGVRAEGCSAPWLAEERALPCRRSNPPIAPCLSPSSGSTCLVGWGETFLCHLLIHHCSVGWAWANQDPPSNLPPSLLH